MLVVGSAIDGCAVVWFAVAINNIVKSTVAGVGADVIAFWLLLFVTLGMEPQGQVSLFWLCSAVELRLLTCWDFS